MINSQMEWTWQLRFNHIIPVGRRNDVILERQIDAYSQAGIAASPNNSLAFALT